MSATTITDAPISTATTVAVVASVDRCGAQSGGPLRAAVGAQVER